MTQVLSSEYAKEAVQLEGDILYTEKCHFAHEQGERRVHWFLGIGGSVLPVLAAAVILRGIGGDWVPGLLALGATLCSTILTVARPAESAEQHSRTGRELNALRVELRQLRALGLENSSVSPADARTELSRLAQEKARIDRDAPAISERRYRQAKQKLEGGRGQKWWRGRH